MNKIPLLSLQTHSKCAQFDEFFPWAFWASTVSLKNGWNCDAGRCKESRSLLLLYCTIQSQQRSLWLKLWLTEGAVPSLLSHTEWRLINCYQNEKLDAAVTCSRLKLGTKVDAKCFLCLKSSWSTYSSYCITCFFVLEFFYYLHFKETRPNIFRYMTATKSKVIFCPTRPIWSFFFFRTFLVHLEQFLFAHGFFFCYFSVIFSVEFIAFFVRKRILFLRNIF